MPYLKNVLNTKKTHQSQPIPGSGQVLNSAGGYAFAVDDWTRLERFLVLGSEGGSYYATERVLTLDNAKAVLRCVAADGARTVTQIVAISDEGRAPKNDPAIFALALAASQGDDATRRAALAALPRVCRTGTHLFHFAAYVDGMRGWGRGLREAVARWYQGQSVEKLAYQAVKYQQRWSAPFGSANELFGLDRFLARFPPTCRELARRLIPDPRVKALLIVVATPQPQSNLRLQH
jgi:60 kDa SS-A/Ro ribonucleoprotein